MADISKLSRLVAGIHRLVDLQQNALVVGSLKVGATDPVELTKTLLNSLLAIRTDLASNANALGASLIGIEDSASQFTATHVEGALAESLDAAQAAQADATQALSDASDAQDAADAAQADATQALADAAAAQDDVDDLITLSGVAANATHLGAFSGTTIPDNQNNKQAFQALESAIENLPNPMQYKGQWDATENDPELANTDTGKSGWLYRVSVAGTVDFGAGNIAFEIGDLVVNNGTVWEKWDVVDNVFSVNGQSGTVVLDTDDIAEDGSPTNLWFTDARAQAASISQVITNGVTTKAPSEDAVFDALALKADANHSHDADEIDYDNSTSGLTATDAQAAIDEVEARVDALEAAPDADPSKESFDIGESLEGITGLRAVRLMKAADASFTAGRIMRADYDATSVDNFHVIGLAMAAEEDAADPMLVYKMGPMTATAHGFTVGQPIFLTAAGALSNTAPSSANQASVIVGYARTANIIEVRIQIMGVN